MGHDGNKNFEIFVESQDDIRGMIAYCIYRFEKAIKFKDKTPTDDEVEEFRKLCVTGHDYDEIRDRATEAVERFADRVIKNHSHHKFWYDVRVGVLAGIIAAVIAPFFWYGAVALIKKSNITTELDGVAHATP
jgi:hypothetical protein